MSRPICFVLPWNLGFCCGQASESWPDSPPRCNPTLSDGCPISTPLIMGKQQNDGETLAQVLHFALANTESTSSDRKHFNLPELIWITGSIIVIGDGKMSILQCSVRTTQCIFTREPWNIIREGGTAACQCLSFLRRLRGDIPNQWRTRAFQCENKLYIMHQTL